MALRPKLTRHQREQLEWMANTCVYAVTDTRIVIKLKAMGFCDCDGRPGDFNTIWSITPAGRAALATPTQDPQL